LGGGVTENLANGNGRVGVWGERVENLEVTDCQFDGFQGIAVGADYYHDVRVDGCYFVGIGNSVSIVEGQNSGFYGAYVFRGRRALMTRCTGVRVRHLYDATESIHVTQSLSMATKTHRAAFGSHEEVYGLTVVDNIAQDCVNGIVCRAFTSSIVSNHFDNCSGPAVTTATMTSSDNSGVLIATGNKLNSVATTNGTVQISGNYSPLVLNANFIENAGVPATGPAIRFNTQKIVNAVVKGNTINAGVGVDVLPPSSVMPTCVGLDISGNTVVSYTGNMVSLRGSTVASTPADNIRIAENFGVPTLESSGNGIIVRLMPLQSPTARDGDAGFIGFASRMNPVALPAGMLQLSENMRLDRGTAKTRKGARRLADEMLPSGFPLTVPFRFDPILTGAGAGFHLGINPGGQLLTT
jgi:hypothetical protein